MYCRDHDFLAGSSFSRISQKLFVAYSGRIVIYAGKSRYDRQGCDQVDFSFVPPSSQRIMNRSSIAPNRHQYQNHPSAKVAVSILRLWSINGWRFLFFARMCIVRAYHFSTSGNGVDAWNVVLVKDKKNAMVDLSRIKIISNILIQEAHLISIIKHLFKMWFCLYVVLL